MNQKKKKENKADQFCFLEAQIIPRINYSYIRLVLKNICFS